MFWKIANEAIQLYKASDSSAIYWWMVTFAMFHFHTVFFQWLELRYLITYSFKFGIKMKTTSTCFLWYAFNWPNMKHFWENWTLRRIQQLFLLSVYHCKWKVEANFGQIVIFKWNVIHSLSEHRVHITVYWDFGHSVCMCHILFPSKLVLWNKLMHNHKI